MSSTSTSEQLSPGSESQDIATVPASSFESNTSSATASVAYDVEPSSVYKRRSRLRIDDLVDPGTYQDAQINATDTSSGSSDLLIAATALGELGSSSPPKEPVAGTTSSDTIFDKVTSHPLISSSINYMLERTIYTSSSYLLSTPLSSTATTHSTVADSTMDGSLISPISALASSKQLSVINLNIESRRKLEMLIHFLKLGNSQLSERIESLIGMVESKRQASDALMLSNSQTPTQLSDNETSDAGQNDPLGEDSRLPTSQFDNGSTVSLASLPRTNSATSADNQGQFLSDESIQQMKDDIVSTVKKIVNVVSKVSASSLSEPARSNVREALLRLPSNWAALFEQEQQRDDENENDKEKEEEDDDDDDDDDISYKSHSNDNESIDDNASLETTYEDSRESWVQDDMNSEKFRNEIGNPNGSAKHIRRSVTQRLLANLFRYTGGVSSRSTTTFKTREWFGSKIRSQMMYDPNGKILVLAQESLDMINKIIKFCNENLDKAETWNTSKQMQQKKTLISKLQDMDYVSQNDNEKIETIVVKEPEDSS
ncbi:hypothetical protein FOA43_003597 [Brettanomyces nanus]|uniref:Uncharacterized protein n=1 Tax=Eeniella nana TaxID=13502 RepID=A0A875S3E3_EENNA|nr:uncharacterized protein FOA43_003597 [Brettanomyces nanus]QPG76211.1 hypothetical protein FOA43_003597 [Brettanomyces nanus]